MRGLVWSGLALVTACGGPRAPEAAAAHTAELGRFQLRFVLPPDAPDCMPSIQGLAPLANGEAWIVGDCGLRGRVTRGGFVALPAPTRPMRKLLGDETVECPAYATFLSVAARSAEDAYFGGLSKCGMDPNFNFVRPLERFDGQRTYDLAFSLPEGDDLPRAVTQIVLGRGHAYILVMGDDWQGPPECDVHELGSDGLKLLRACLPPHTNQPIVHERFSSIALDGAGDLWISAERFPAVMGEVRGTPLLWRRSQGTWQEHPAPEKGRWCRPKTEPCGSSASAPGRAPRRAGDRVG